jgi:acetyl-CoA decarbonylase/synthase complex subunit gamma
MELVPAAKIALPLAAGLALVAALGGQASFVTELLSSGLVAAAAIIAGTVAGAVLSPLLLPWIPGRAFAVKGTVIAALVAFPALIAVQLSVGTGMALPWAELIGLGLIAMTLSSFAAMNFTGSSTYTSLSGVEKEMRVAVPAQLVFGIVGVLAFIGGRFFL